MDGSISTCTLHKSPGELPKLLFHYCTQQTLAVPLAMCQTCSPDESVSMCLPSGLYVETHLHLIIFFLILSYLPCLHLWCAGKYIKGQILNIKKYLPSWIFNKLFLHSPMLCYISILLQKKSKIFQRIQIFLIILFCFCYIEMGFVMCPLVKHATTVSNKTLLKTSSIILNIDDWNSENKSIDTSQISYKYNN